MKHNLLSHLLWIRSDQFHPRLWDVSDVGLGWYSLIDKRYIPLQRKSDYIFKGHRHMHLSNYK